MKLMHKNDFPSRVFFVHGVCNFHCSGTNLDCSMTEIRIKFGIGLEEWTHGLPNAVMMNNHISVVFIRIICPVLLDINYKFIFVNSWKNLWSPKVVSFCYVINTFVGFSNFCHWCVYFLCY